MKISVPSRQNRRQPLAVGLVTAGVLTLGLAGAGAAAAAPAPSLVAPSAVTVGVNAVTPPSVVNLANVGNLVVSGTADSGVTQVTVAIDDEDPGTDSIVDTVTLPGGSSGQTWTSGPMDVSGLADGPLTVFSSFDGMSPTVDPTMDKDTLAPDFPTALPDAGAPFAAATLVAISALDADDQSRTHYTTGTPTAANPTAADPVVPAQLTVARTEQVKAISFDAAGNPSPITTMNFVVVTPPVVTPPVVTPPVFTPPVVTPPVVRPPAKPQTAKLNIVRVSPAGAESLSIRNNGHAGVNLRGWRLMDKAGHVLRLTSYSLRPGATVRIFTGSGRAAAGRLFLGSSSDVWGAHDTARLISNKGVKVSSLRY